MKIGITGATGHLGQITVKKLKEKIAAQNIVALVRNPEKMIEQGIETRVFDYSISEGQDESLKDIEVLLLISSSEIGQREVQHKNVIDAAKRAGVNRIIYTSLLHANSVSLGLAPEHVFTENYIKDSGISYTLLRNGWYTENYAVSIPGFIQGDSVIGSTGEGKISSATREDFADAAVVVLTTEGHDNKVYELAGDEAYTLSEFAQELSRQTQKHIPFKNLSEVEFTTTLIEIGVPKSFAELLANSDICASKGDLFADDKTLSKLIGRPTTPLSEVIKRFL